MRAKDVIHETAQAFNFESQDLCGMSRKQELVLARQTAMYILWQRTNCTLARIGKALGNRTPATVSWGYQRIAKQIDYKPELKEKLERINETLFASL